MDIKPSSCRLKSDIEQSITVQQKFKNYNMRHVKYSWNIKSIKTETTKEINENDNEVSDPKPIKTGEMIQMTWFFKSKKRGGSVKYPCDPQHPF